MKLLFAVLLFVGCAVGQLSYTPVVDAEMYGTGTDGAAKIASIIANSSLCPNSGSNIGCTIDARGMTGTDLVFQTNPFQGNNRSVVLLLGAHTYVACVPWVSGQTGYMVVGVDAPSSSPSGTRIRAGDGADGCPAAFPNGVSTLSFGWQHGLYPSGTYAALYNDCGDPSTGNPITTTDCFGGELWNLQLDCGNSAGTPLAGCSFGYYTTTSEERGGLHNVSVRNVAHACGFWDRSMQVGPPAPGGSGPTHFSLVDTTCSPNTAMDNTVDGWVAELNPTTITFSGPSFPSSCTPTTNPTASGVPTAYVLISTGSPAASGVITNAGNCTSPPTTCVLNSGGSPSATACTVTHSTTAITGVSFSGGSGYPTAALPGGGPLILRSTIVGQDATHRLREAIAIEGDRETVIEHVHTESVGSDTILHGFGTAPYSGGAFMAVNTTTGTGGCVHQGVGALSTDYAMLDIAREISTGCVIVDDNIISGGLPFTLATTDTPSHRRVGVYSPSQNVITRINTINPCAAVGTAASPSVVSCGNSASGAFSCATNASGATCVVNTTQVSATNQIQITQVSNEGGHLGVTCNGTASNMFGAWVSSRSIGVSFTVTLPTFATHPLCFTYHVENN